MAVSGGTRLAMEQRSVLRIIWVIGEVKGVNNGVPSSSVFSEIQSAGTVPYRTRALLVMTCSWMREEAQDVIPKACRTRSAN